MAQFFDNTLTNNVVWQTCKWLCADNIGCSLVDEFDHFTGQEPAFTSLVSDGNNMFGGFCGILDVGSRFKMFTLCKFITCIFSKPFKEFD